MITKTRRNRKNCVHFHGDEEPVFILGKCYAKLGMYYCKGVSCGWYKEKEK